MHVITFVESIRSRIDRRLLLPALAAVVLGAAATALAQDVPTPSEVLPDVTVLELLQKGGALMYPLYACSILMVAFGIERAISLRRARVLPPEIVTRVRTVIADSQQAFDATSLQREIEADASPLSRILCAGLRKTGRAVADIEKAIQYAGEKEVTMLRRNGRVLSVVAGVAPLLGLLGTVFGMIQAFITVASREEALGRTELLAAGIYQALVTTAVGLSVAIPALVLYHIYAEKADRLVLEMDDIAIELVDRLAVAHEQAKGT